MKTHIIATMILVGLLGSAFQFQSLEAPTSRNSVEPNKETDTLQDYYTVLGGDASRLGIYHKGQSYADEIDISFVDETNGGDYSPDVSGTLNSGFYEYEILSSGAVKSEETPATLYFTMYTNDGYSFSATIKFHQAGKYHVVVY